MYVLVILIIKRIQFYKINHVQKCIIYYKFTKVRQISVTICIQSTYLIFILIIYILFKKLQAAAVEGV